ncbi:MAG: helix-turn-helix domain-containing protein [Sumerlaeia bacterium]
MSSNFFSEALRQGMKERHYNQAQLAEFLNVDPAYISRWLKGSSPRLDQLRNVLEILGWQLSRARPDYDPFADAIDTIDQSDSADKAAGGSVKDKNRKYGNMKEIKSLLEDAAKSQKQPEAVPLALLGSMDAESGITTLNLTEKFFHDSLNATLEKQDFAETELYCIKVTASSPNAPFPANSTVLLRKILRPSGVPTKSLVLMEPASEPGKLYLRKLVRLRDEAANRVDRLIGSPVSPSQDYLYFKPREVKLHSVVVGYVTQYEFEPYEDVE